MGKKTKSKARLDKFYHLAKEIGFRSRAAFKLIQLNKKYRFLETANCVLDLCAAPGGWLQVAAKYCPLSSIKIGIDLVSIKSIPGCVTFQSDITSEACRTLIKKEIKHFKVDVVLNDGAPNVGGGWSKDAYNQCELVIHAAKLASEFLKPGGVFVTKVFRSSDYNSLIYVLKQVFNKVEATKPQASRNESAEIFIVCTGFKAPSYIDPKLFDPKFVLKQELEDEQEMKMNSIKSIKAMFQQKKNREGYYTKMFNEETFKSFIDCANPYHFLLTVNKIKVTEECQKLIAQARAPKEYEIFFDDVKLLGKSEIQQLIIWRHKIRSKLSKSKNKAKEQEQEQNKEQEENAEEEDYEENQIKEMDKELNLYEKQRKRKLEQEEKRREKNDIKQKMSFIKEQENDVNDGAVEFDENLFKYLQQKNISIEDLGYKEIKDTQHQLIEPDNEIDLSDLSQDDYYELMNEDIERNMELYEETKGQKAGKKQKKKEKMLLEKEKRYKEHQIQEEKDEAQEFGEEKVEEEMELSDINNHEMDDDEELFENPLSKRKQKNIEVEKIETVQNEEENESSDTDEENKELLGKKRKGKQEIEEIAQSESDDEYDTDEKAEIRAIAKKMLRKKERQDILFNSYNRYTFDDTNLTPKWFSEDERAHNQPQKPVTKEEVMIEKEELRKINAKMPKKVLEAKRRKKNKMIRKMEKVKKIATNISNQEEITEVSKVRQIEKLYKKEMIKLKPKKKYIVSKGNSKATKKGAKKGGKTLKFVDRRMKKDTRAQKARDKRNKK